MRPLVLEVIQQITFLDNFEDIPWKMLGNFILYCQGAQTRPLIFGIFDTPFQWQHE